MPFQILWLIFHSLLQMGNVSMTMSYIKGELHAKVNSSTKMWQAQTINTRATPGFSNALYGVLQLCIDQISVNEHCHLFTIWTWLKRADAVSFSVFMTHYYKIISLQKWIDFSKPFFPQKGCCLKYWSCFWEIASCDRSSQIRLQRSVLSFRIIRTLGRDEKDTTY